MLPSAMGLGPGARIGPYEIVALIGEGGMGQVYRGVDIRLKREVALKVLPAALKADPERLARFRREAELLAALNHPNIAHLYGLEQADGEQALVMELAGGATLAELIAAGPLPFDDALAIARQVLEALEAAHERGIVHRDLKPANIKIAPDGTVKVLDFGLAKALDASSGATSSAGHAATITSPALTTLGLILGTAAYMAPEQARGRAVDRRADLWAFGCVLYEMLTGTRAFDGDDVTETLANVLKSEARLAELRSPVPPRVRQVIDACLQKDPRRRLSSAQDARLVLDGAFEATSMSAVAAAVPSAPIWRRVLPYAVGALGAAVVVGLVAWRLAPAPARQQVSRFDIPIPDGQDLRNIGRPVVSVAPDGSALIYNATGGIRLRTMSELATRVIPGTEWPVTAPVFSPDGQHVAFYSTADDQLKRVALAGGSPLVIARNMDNPLGMDWSESGTILLARAEGIARVADTGGTLELVVKCGANERVALPQLLPGAEAVLFTSVTSVGEPQWDQAQVVVQSLRTGQRTKILDGARDARYLPTGHLVYAVKDALFGVAFDPATLTTSGGSIQLVQGIWWRNPNTVVANWSVSRNGTLTYVPNVPPDTLRPVWVTRDGAVAPLEHVPPGDAPRLSPDGKQLLVEADNDVWIYDIDTGRRKRLTTDRSSGRPAWHPTGKRIAYSSSQSGSNEIWVMQADATGTPRRLTDLPGAAHVDSWSPDGKTLAFHHHPPGDAPNEIMIVEPDDPASKPRPLVQGFAAEDAVFSPDGRYIAYLSAQSGRREVYVRAFPGPGPQVPVSVGGGREPVWGRNGEIFYRTATGDQMMAVRVTTMPSLGVGAPVRLFEGTYFMQPRITGSPRPQYDVTADGRRLLMLQPNRTVKPHIVVVQNWFEELRRLVPAR